MSAGFERKRLQTIPMPRPIFLRKIGQVIVPIMAIYVAVLTTACVNIVNNIECMRGIAIGAVVLAQSVLCAIIFIRRLGTSIANKEVELGFNCDHYETLLIASFPKILEPHSESKRIAASTLSLTIFCVSLAVSLHFRSQELTLIALIPSLILLVSGMLGVWSGLSIPVNRWIERNWAKAQKLGIANEAEVCQWCDSNLAEGRCKICGYRTPDHPQELRWYDLVKTPISREIILLDRKVGRLTFLGLVGGALLMCGSVLLYITRVAVSDLAVPLVVLTAVGVCVLGLFAPMGIHNKIKASGLSREVGHSKKGDLLIAGARRIRNYPEIGLGELEEMIQSYEIPVLSSVAALITLIVLGFALLNAIFFIPAMLTLYLLIRWVRECSKLLDDAAILECREELRGWWLVEGMQMIPGALVHKQPSEEQR